MRNPHFVFVYKLRIGHPAWAARMTVFFFFFGVDFTQNMATASGDTTVPELTEEQRKAIAEKRERAIQIRKAKLALRSITER